jgi:hypothetical protein
VVDSDGRVVFRGGTENDAAGAQGPMQFLPSTFAQCSGGGDVLPPHDSIMAAARYLAANGFAETTPSSGTTNRTGTSGRSTTTPPCSQPIPLRSSATTGGISTTTTAGDVLLPTGYVATAPISITGYWRPTRSENMPVRCQAATPLLRLIGDRSERQAQARSGQRRFSGPIIIDTMGGRVTGLDTDRRPDIGWRGW